MEDCIFTTFTFEPGHVHIFTEEKPGRSENPPSPGQLWTTVEGN